MTFNEGKKIDHHHYAAQELNFPLIHLPPANPNFIGRDDLLDAIQSSFANQQSSITITQTIAGLGGVGKTQLALAYAHANRDSYDLIWWLNAENETALNESLIALGRVLGLPVDTMDRPAAIQTILTWITSTDKRWLLVYDNVDKLEPRELRPYLPGGRGHALITSRNPHWQSTGQVLNVNVFKPEEAVVFLEARFGQTDGQAHAEIGALAEELGYLPLALEHAAAYMETRGKTSAEYLHLFRDQRQALLKRAKIPDTYHATITTTWEIAFEHARQTSGAADLLNLCCFLTSDNIPLAVIKEHSEMLPKTLANVVINDLELDDALIALTRYSLLKKQDNMLAIHRLVQAVVRDQMGEKDEKDWLETSIALLSKAYNFDQHDMATWPICGQLLPHVMVVLDLAIDFKIYSNDEAYLNNETGYYLRHYGQLAEARPYYNRVLTIREQKSGSNHPDTAISLNSLGYLHKEMGKYAEAEGYYERALSIRKEALGSEHPDTARSLNNLGVLFQAMGNLNKAWRYYKSALEIYIEKSGSTHPDTAVSYSNLGYLLVSMGEFAEAKDYYEKARPIFEEKFEPFHPVIARSLSNVGYLFVSIDNYAGALPYYERALEINQKAFGSNHPDTAFSLNNLGYLMDSMGKYAEALTYYERALEINEKKLGSNHPDTAINLNNLGYLMDSMGKYAEARDYYERALDIREKTLDRNHPDTATSLNNLGSILQAMGQHEEARPFFERALSIREKALGPNHPDTARSIWWLGVFAERDGDLVEAEKLFQRALKASENALGENHPRTQNIRSYYNNVA